jgi:hypothetical protein
MHRRSPGRGALETALAAGSAVGYSPRPRERCCAPEIRRQEDDGLLSRRVTMSGRCGFFACICLAVALAVGCEAALREMKLPGGPPTTGELQAESRMADRQRERYRETQDATALRWLLAKRIRSGMTLAEVNRELGQDGSRRYEDSRFKARNIGVQRTDETWEWGPDKHGATYLLFFRNDRLVNYEPSQYDDSADEAGSFE